MTLLPVAIFLMGPTASGKTQLAIKLCQKLPCEIISVDSAMVYQGMDIGTNKPSLQEQKQAPHRLIDIIDPSVSYSVASFYQDATKAMAEIAAQGRIPLLVGGTMLYFHALLKGLALLPSANCKIRTELAKQARLVGWSSMHKQLCRQDPVAGQQIHPNDWQRTSRALEVLKITGKPLSQLQQQQSPPLPYRLFQFAIIPNNRSQLHQIISERFFRILSAGFEQEVIQLYQRQDLSNNLPAMRSVGYRQMWCYLSKKYNHKQMIESSLAATRQLAKRQLTWLKNWPELYHLYLDDKQNIEKISTKISLNI